MCCKLKHDLLLKVICTDSLAYNSVRSSLNENKDCKLPPLKKVCVTKELAFYVFGSKNYAIFYLNTKQMAINLSLRGTRSYLITLERIEKN